MMRVGDRKLGINKFWPYNTYFANCMDSFQQFICGSYVASYMMAIAC